jgi:hypothetical protein
MLEKVLLHLLMVQEQPLKQVLAQALLFTMVVMAQMEQLLQAVEVEVQVLQEMVEQLLALLPEQELLKKAGMVVLVEVLGQVVEEAS